MLDTERILQALNDLSETICSIKIEKNEIMTKFDNIENKMIAIGNNMKRTNEELLKIKEMLKECRAQINDIP